MRQHLTLTAMCLSVLTSCGDARSHPELMADAAADAEVIEFEPAMARYDSARAASPDDTDAHRQYATLASYFSLHADAVRAWERVLELEPGDAAAWEGYIHDLRWAGIFETDRRYGEKILQVLPEALCRAPDRPVIYSEAQDAAADLGQLDAYGAILSEVRAMRPGDQILLHAADALRVALAEREEGERAQVVRDSIGAALDALAADAEDDADAAAPVLYRLAAGYEDFGSLRREDDADRWLERLEAVADRGVLADDLRYWDLTFDFDMARLGYADSTVDMSRLAAEGLKSPDLGRRGAWVDRNHTVVTQRALASIAGDAPSRRTVWGAATVAAEPPHAPLEPEVAEQLFVASMDVVRWREGVFSALRGLLYFGIEPRAVLDAALAIEEDLRAHSPGYLYPGLRGDERERSRQDHVAVARIL